MKIITKNSQYLKIGKETKLRNIVIFYLVIVLSYIFAINLILNDKTKSILSCQYSELNKITCKITYVSLINSETTVIGSVTNAEIVIQERIKRRNRGGSYEVTYYNIYLKNQKKSIFSGISSQSKSEQENNLRKITNFIANYQKSELQVEKGDLYSPFWIVYFSFFVVYAIVIGFLNSTLAEEYIFDKKINQLLIKLKLISGKIETYEYNLEDIINISIVHSKHRNNISYNIRLNLKFDKQAQLFHTSLSDELEIRDMAFEIILFLD